MPQFLYRCASEGAVNNNLKSACDFEMVFEEAPHHCPICGNELLRVSDGLTVSEILRLGQQRADQQKSQRRDILGSAIKEEGTTKK
jgi:hypothetical protein